MTMTGFTVDGFSFSILNELAQAPADAGMSLPKLGKRLKQGASVVLRQLTLMSDASIAGQPGPGWVRIERDEERWVAYITDAGRASWEAVREQQ
jgi:hypothetical protein